MVSEQSIKEAFTKIKEDIELIKIEIQELNKKINDMNSYEELEVRRWSVPLEDGKKKARWDGNGNVKEWEKKRRREEHKLLNLFPLWIIADLKLNSNNKWLELIKLSSK